MSKRKTKPIIPDAALRQHLAVIGKTGSGKTYTAKGIVERLLAAGQRVCILDPTGAWWGLRTSADGEHPGFPVTIFGGERGDVPINEHAGEAVARLLAGGNIPAVIDLSDTWLAERRRFAEKFFETLFKTNRAPLHLVIDEADEFFPQNASDDGCRRLQGAVDRIIRRGRIKGFRVMMITQRPAVLHKNAITQAGTLIAMRLPAPQDRKAIEDWIKGQADAETGKAVLGSLSSLECGEGWVWSPEHGVLERTVFPALTTFDSSRTPEDDEIGQEPPRTIAEVDLAGIEEALAKAVADAEANDPAKLKKRVRSLEAQLEAAHRAPVVMPADIDAIVARAKAEASEAYQRLLVETELAADRQVEDLRACVARAETIAAELHALFALMSGAGTKGGDELLRPFRESMTGSAMLDGQVRRTLAAEDRLDKGPYQTVVCGQPPRSAADAEARGSLTGPQQRVLDALAWWASVGVSDPSRAQVGFVAGIKPQGGHFGNTVGPLKTAGLIDYQTQGTIALTEQGIPLADWPEAPPTIEVYQRGMLDMLKTGPQRKIVEALIELGPGREIEREELGARTGINPSGGHFGNTVGPLRTLGLVEYPSRGMIAATDLVWPDGLARRAAG